MYYSFVNLTEILIGSMRICVMVYGWRNVFALACVDLIALVMVEECSQQFIGHHLNPSITYKIAEQTK